MKLKDFQKMEATHIEFKEKLEEKRLKIGWNQYLLLPIHQEAQ